MIIISLRLSEKEEELFRIYATNTGKTLSELFKSSLLEQIETQLDYEIGVQTLKKFDKNSVIHSIDDVITELENSI